VKPKQRRLTFVVIGLGLLGVAAALVIYSSQESLVFFRTPTELASQPPDESKRLRLGGLVEDNSVTEGAGTEVRFRVTDFEAVVPVVFSGILPDLFREGQGVVVEGRMQNGTFVADSVLAKHDENYMPPEVADALKESGHWQKLEGGTDGNYSQ
jgi:cytochrome c-type biogenesis protein CcmE